MRTRSHAPSAPPTPHLTLRSTRHHAPLSLLNSLSPPSDFVDWAKWGSWFNDSSTRFCALLTEKMALAYSGRTTGSTLNLPCRDAGAPGSRGGGGGGGGHAGQPLLLPCVEACGASPWLRAAQAAARRRLLWGGTSQLRLVNGAMLA